MKKKLENIVEGAKIAGVCITALAVIPFIVGYELIKEELVGRLTGETQRRDKEYKSVQKRFSEERERIAKRERLYSEWTAKSKPIISETIESHPEYLEKPIIETTKQNWGASFWDFPSYETKFKKKEDGKYIIEYEPGADEETRRLHSKVDDNNGQGYSLEKAAERYARLSTENIFHEDIEIQSFYRPPGIDYNQVKKEVATTKRKDFIKEIKEKTGVDLRKGIKEMSQDK